MKRLPKRQARGFRTDTVDFELCAPRELEAFTFSVEDDEYALFVFPMEEIEPPQGLTRTEREVARALFQGKSNADIGRERGTSPRTIANQLRSIYGKLGVSGRVELIQRCTARPDRSGDAV
jgi:DNA-binding CsgD family transcriptional regulator